MTEVERRDRMVQRPQWHIERRIQAPVHRVWEAIEDLSLISKYHPQVSQVEYTSGETVRAIGVDYRCTVPDRPGRKGGWCVERVVSHDPVTHTTAVEIPEDSWGLARMLTGFRTEVSARAHDGGSTIVRMESFYTPSSLWMAMLNVLLLRGVMRRRAGLVLDGLARMIESARLPVS